MLGLCSGPASLARLDHCLILGNRHLYRLTKEYKAYFNDARPHQGIDQRIPCQPELPTSPPTDAKISSQPVLNGLHHGKKQSFFLKENPAVYGGILHDDAWGAAECASAPPSTD